MSKKARIIDEAASLVEYMIEPETLAKLHLFASALVFSVGVLATMNVIYELTRV